VIKDYVFSKTSKIQSFITQINTYRDLFDKFPKQPQLQENLLRKSTLKSALFSARIEGNRLDLNDVESGRVESKEKNEIFQIYEAIKFVRSQRQELTKGLICNIHEIVMDGLTSELGRFRTEPSAIYNSAGIAVYIAPPVDKVGGLVSSFIEYTNILEIDICRAAVAHFAFEKIHPFLDGNGRVGRILLNWHLAKLGYEFIWFSSFEEYIENNRDKYYETLSNQTKDITSFIEFILEAIAESSEKIILQLGEQKEEKIEDLLSPRRAEMLTLIREHQIMSFDEIRRRFMMVYPRTLHFDLSDLIKKGLIRKLGTTRGAVYAPK